MTCEEFSNEFDTLLNSYNKSAKFESKQVSGSIELDEYEKSSLLTQAQEELVLEYYSGKNPFRDHVDNKEEVRRYLSQLVKDYETTVKVSDLDGLSSESCFYEIPSNTWFILYEQVTFSEGGTAVVKPVTYDTYNSFSRNPFKGTNKNRALRLDSEDNIVQIIPDRGVDSYSMRYISQPLPIILTDLPDLSINGVSNKTECVLNPALHRSILKRAVEIALKRFNVSGN